MSMLKIKIKYRPSWEANAEYSFNDKTPFPGAKAILTHYVRCRFGFSFETLKEVIPDFFAVLCSVLKTVLFLNSSSELPERLSFWL